MSKNVTKLPNWICKRIDEAGVERVRAAVHKAELSTSAEIVPMIVRRSSAIAHVPTSLFLFLSLVWMCVFPFVAVYVSDFFASYAILATANELFGFLLAAVLSAMLGHLSFFQRIFVPKIDQVAQVDDRAELEFFESNIKKTDGSTGILIFVSLLEPFLRGHETRSTNTPQPRESLRP